MSILSAGSISLDSTFKRKHKSSRLEDTKIRHFKIKIRQKMLKLTIQIENLAKYELPCRNKNHSRAFLTGKGRDGTR
jgi:hypothetical protein